MTALKPISGRKAQIINILMDNPSATTGDIARTLNISDKNVHVLMMDMRKQKMIRKVVGWEVTVPVVDSVTGKARKQSPLKLKA